MRQFFFLESPGVKTLLEHVFTALRHILAYMLAFSMGSLCLYAYLVRVCFWCSSDLDFSTILTPLSHAAGPAPQFGGIQNRRLQKYGAKVTFGCIIHNATGDLLFCVIF